MFVTAVPGPRREESNSTGCSATLTKNKFLLECKAGPDQTLPVCSWGVEEEEVEVVVVVVV